MDKIHHLAIQVKSIKESVDWYTKTFQCEVAYQDDTWAMLQFDNIALALVIPEQHPYHFCFEKPTAEAESFGELKTHRDGTRTVYTKDINGNVIEILDSSSLDAYTS